MAKRPDNILVIRLSALGDIVLCFQAFQEIRGAHPTAKIALLTMPAFAAFAKAMPWFDEVIIDERASGWNLGAWWRLSARLRQFNPKRVYDLQGKTRQNILFYLMGGPLTRDWSGAALLGSHKRLSPAPLDIHFTSFVADQLRRAEVPVRLPANLDWLDAPLKPNALPPKFAVIIPGCGVGRDYKKWPAEKYAALAQKLHARGMAVVAIGTNADRAAIDAVCKQAPFIINLCNKTSLFHLGAIARRASLVVGNDTGPTHLMAAVGAPTLALMSDKVNVIWSRPKGPNTGYLKGRPLSALTLDEVLMACDMLLGKGQNLLLHTG